MDYPTTHRHSVRGQSRIQNLNNSKYSNEHKQMYISINEFSKEIESKNKQDFKIYHPRPKMGQNWDFLFKPG